MADKSKRHDEGAFKITFQLERHERGFPGASAWHLLQSAFPGAGQPTTNCKPTTVSGVALAARKETAQVWSPTNPVLRDAAQA